MTGRVDMTTVLATGTIADFLEEKWGSFPLNLLDGLGVSSQWAVVLAAIIHASLVMGFFGAVPLIFIWLERKVSGRIQDRLGPTRVGGKFGWLQGPADGLKLIQKEDLVPKEADSMLFRAAPYIACVAAFCAFMVMPFYDGWAAVASDIGLFILFAVLSLEVLGIILAGYSRDRKSVV